MATAIAPGTVEKTVTYKEVVPSDDQRVKRKRPPIWEFLPTIPSKDWKDLHYVIYLYRYHPTTEKRMAVEKCFEAIDPFWVQKKYGGGSFNIMVSEDGQLIYNEDFEIEGEPKMVGTVIADTSHPNSGGTTDMLIRELLAEIRMGRGGTIAADSMKQAMDLNARALQTGVEAVRATLVMPAGPAAPDPMAELMRDFMKAMIMKAMNPPETNGFKDTLALINEIKGAGLLGGPPKADLASTLVSSIPMLADRFVAGLRESRLETEAKMQTIRLERGEMRPSDPNVITMEHPAPQNTATPPAAAPQTFSAEMTQQVIMQADLQRLVNAMKHPDCTGEDIYDFLSHVWPEMLDEMSKFSKESLLLFFRSREMQMAKLGNAILYEMGSDPRLPKMVEEFLKVANENAAPPATTV